MCLVDEERCDITLLSDQVITAMLYSDQNGDSGCFYTKILTVVIHLFRPTNNT